MKFKITYLIIPVILFAFNFALADEHTANNSNAVAAGAIVVPNAYSGTPGTATFLGPLANTQRTYQLLINESELTAIQGDMIEAITFRLPVSATSDWPVSDITFANYDIYLSGSVAPQDRSLTFINNVVGIQKNVRAGSLTIPLNSYSSGGTPNAFGREITFDSSYLYTGGHLLIEIRHNGFTGTSRSVDAIGTSISGYGTLFSACWTGSYTGTSGSQGNFSVVSITVGGVVGVHELTEIPSSFSLGQNYPNPFNPSTIIHYSIPTTQFTILKVYDVLGNEIAVLVDERQSAGNYNYQFSIVNYQLSSGVYFYRIETESFIDTKKMLITK